METYTERIAEKAMELQSSFYKAIIERDDLFMETHLHSGFTFTSADAEFNDKRSFIDGILLNTELRFAHIRNIPGQMTIIGATAVLTSTVEVNILKGDQSIAFLKRLTQTYVCEDQEWKVMAIHGTYIPEKNVLRVTTGFRNKSRTSTLIG